jgi:hypothetical protein
MSTLEEQRNAALEAAAHEASKVVELKRALQSLYDWVENNVAYGAPAHVSDEVQLALSTAGANPRPKPLILVNMDGGLVQDVMADCDVDVLVIDYDVGGSTPDDNVVDLPQYQTQDTSRAWVNFWEPGVDAAQCNFFFTAAKMLKE